MLASILTRVQIEQLRRRGQQITPEERHRLEEAGQQMAEAFRQIFPADSIIPLTHLIFENHLLEAAIDHNADNGRRIPGRIRLIARLQGWSYQKYLQFLYWKSAKDETDALVIATSNKRSQELDPRIHEFFEVVDMQPLTEEQRGHVLQFHAQGKHLAPEVDLNGIAQDTEGFTGDELAAIVNNAALEAATQNHQEITREDVDAAFAEQVERKEQDVMRNLI